MKNEYDNTHYLWKYCLDSSNEELNKKFEHLKYINNCFNENRVIKFILQKYFDKLTPIQS
jgi:hypothetical protein